MTQTLPTVAHDHHERILAMVERFPGLGDALLGEHADDARDELRAVRDFLVGTLLPHVEATETALYPSLERMLQNRHSMVPMRREHEEVRRLVRDFDAVVRQLGDRHLMIGHAMAARRLLFQLYALIKVHLTEEEAYVRIIEHGLPAEVSDMLAAQLEHPLA